MKLLTKYSRINLLMMVGVFLLSSIAFYFLVNYILVLEMDADLGGIQEKVRQYTAQHNHFPDGHPLDEEQISYLPDSMATTTPTTFKLIQLYSPREKKMHNYRQMTFPVALNGKAYKVVIAKPLEGLHHLSRAIKIVALSTVLLTITVTLIINRVILRRLWKPFYDAIHAMRQFKLGKNEKLEFPGTPIDEFAFMNESLRMAAEKAEQDYRLLKEFTENASHELQTPLSILRSKLDLLIQDSDLSHHQSEIVSSAYASIRKLSRLNQSLLLLTKIGNQQFNDIHPIDLREKIEDKLRQFHELWDSKEIRVSWELEPSWLSASPELVDILLNNLFSNACNHNFSKGAIDIQLRPNQMSIGNTGQPAPLDSQRVFTRFYKGGLQTEHNGLGLSIIKQICEVSAIAPAYQFVEGKHAFIFTW